MQRAPAMLSLLLFVALCASAAYWLLQWFAPEPRAVAAPPEAARPLPSVAAASTLFGGRPQGPGGIPVQLRGILLAGRASVAILAAEGKPPRALPVDAEVVPGVTVKRIDARTVLLSERGVERELALPAFAAQEGGTGALQAGVAPEQQQQPLQPPQQAQPQAQPQPPQAGAPSSAGAGNAGSSAAGNAPGQAEGQYQGYSAGGPQPMPNAPPRR